MTSSSAAGSPFRGPTASSAKKPQARYPVFSIGSDLRRSISLDDPHPKTKRKETHIHRSISLGDPPRGGRITGDHRKLKNPCILALGRPARVPAAMGLKEIQAEAAGTARRRRGRRRGEACGAVEVAGDVELQSDGCGCYCLKCPWGPVGLFITYPPPWMDGSEVLQLLWDRFERASSYLFV
ncbi:uncharacterized protein A4U43_C01F610 [Asparagus officinalis]|uniref:Uncharacterized protein n=1 Tax=Asparagus officinalis TaxID=4686 RepID=A0A5P1FKZ1_ASPOF|nr:uncharacterized protein A4U43_C01F610 [Asparagus officinalis]